MGCTSCKRNVDASNPQPVPQIIVASESLLAQHGGDIAAIQRELAKHGPEHIKSLMEASKEKPTILKLKTVDRQDSGNSDARRHSSEFKSPSPERKKNQNHRIRQYLQCDNESSIMHNVAPAELDQDAVGSSYDFDDEQKTTTQKKRSSHFTKLMMQDEHNRNRTKKNRTI